MDSRLLKRALEIADDALEMGDDERARFLADACGSDAGLRVEVEGILNHSGGLSILPGSQPAEMPELPPVSDRFVLREELSRGGMGTIFYADDRQLDREVAVKVLQDRYLKRPDIIRRFFNEAKVCGKMQHPGTPPVYAFGTLHDGRPFIAMKLVRGETLSTILQRPREQATRAWLLTVFKRICETIAYAHSRGIIHRDLKPDNVMVSQFGDVQVMDWGLAKSLAEDFSDEQAEDEGRDDTFADAEQIPVGSGSGFTTRAGIVMGTPAYMPPEQMRGERARTIDVFQLGAILCEILTGRPPYHSDSPVDVYSMAKAGELQDALDRLDAAETDRELIEIARRCLELTPEKRFADAGELAAEVVGYLNSVRTRLQEVELAAARTETRLAEERKRRGIVTGLSTAVAVAVIASLAGLSWAMILRAQHADDVAAHAEELAASAEEIAAQTQELARIEREDNLRRSQLEAGFNTALLEATRLFERAKAAPLDDMDAWDEARDAIASAEAFVELNPETQPLAPALNELKDSFQSTEAELRIALAVTQARDATFEAPEFVPWGDTRPKLDKLDRVVSDNGFHPDSRADEPIIIDRIRSLPPAIREKLIGAMDEWYLTADESHRETFTKILHESDPVPWRKQWRSAFTKGDADALKQVFSDPAVGEQSARSLVNLVRSMQPHLDANPRIEFLQQLYPKHASDAWYNYLLADLLRASNRTAEAVPFYQMFLLARPNHRARVCLAYALLRQQSFAEAVAHLQQAVHERPEIQAYRTLLIFALMRSERFEEAVTICEASLKIHPEDTYARLALGAGLLELGQFEESVSQLKPLTGNVPSEISWQVSVLLAKALRKNGQSQEALQVFETIDLDKNPLLAGRLAETLCEFSEEALRFSNQESDQSRHWRERARQWMQVCRDVQDFDPTSWRTNEESAVRFKEILVDLPEADTSSDAEGALWKPVSPSGHSTYSGDELVPQADGSFLIQGEHRPYDVYTIQFQCDTVTAVKLEAIPDEQFPQGGPGRAATGHFELGELALEVVSDDPASRPTQLQFARCVSEEGSTGLPVERCIDGSLRTAWRSDAAGRPQAAVFVLEQPIALNSGQHLQLRLRHGGNSGAGIGRFRVHVTDRPFATELELPTLALSQ